MISNADRRNNQLNVGTSAAPQLQHHRVLTTKVDETGSRYRRPSDPFFIAENASEACSTATTTVTAHSSERESPDSQAPKQQSPPESFVMLRTNFLNKRSNVSPVTKSYVPAASVRTPPRPRKIKHNQSSPVPCTPERCDDDSSCMVNRSPRTTTSIMSISPPRNPLDPKRIELFDDSVSVFSDHVPFDQIWNQQETTSVCEEPTPTSDTQAAVTTVASCATTGQINASLEEPANDHDAPFDEPDDGPKNKSHVSEFSAASPPSPSQPEYSMRSQQKARSIINSRFNTRDILAEPERFSNGDPLETRKNVSLIRTDSGSDVPSDEDETNRMRPETHSRPKKMYSLASASRQRTLEHVGQRIAKDLSPVNSKRDGDSEDPGDDDSLFDFKERLLVSPSNNLPDHVSSDEEVEHEKADLRTRAKEAFASRRRYPKKSTPLRTLSPRDPLPDAPAKSPNEMISNTPAKPRSQVSFGATNTVHHFENEGAYSDHDDSVISLDQKTIGSDLEDAFRDVFMINALGNCGTEEPRECKARRHTGTRRAASEIDNQSDTSDNEDDDEDTLNSYDDLPEQLPETGKQGNDSREAPQREDVIYETMMSVMQVGLGGLGAVTAALGLVPSQDAAEEESPACAMETSRPSSSKRSRRLSPGNIPTPRPTSPPKNERRRSLERQKESTVSVEDSEMIDYIEPVLGPNDEATLELAQEADLEPAQSVEMEYEDQFRIVGNARKPKKEPHTLEEDPRLLELAKQAALCIHEVQGAKYDESREVDIADIKFSVVELAIPLGSKCISCGALCILLLLSSVLEILSALMQLSSKRILAAVGSQK